MSRDQKLNTEPIQDDEQLLQIFRSGEKPTDRFGVGTEHEKFIFRREDCQMISYEEPGGLGDIFQRLVNDFGWQPSYDNGNILAVEKKGYGAVTLEPGGQFELSGEVCKTIFDTENELDSHLREIKSIAGGRLYFTSLGVNPIYSPEEIPWMPKTRYKIMRDYLPTRGDLAWWMMKTSCTIQANFDYESEEDAADTVRTALLISPIVSSIFASSPLAHKKHTNMQSFRGHIWTRTDPDRTGFPEFMYRDDWGYKDYLNYILDVPMFFIRRGDTTINMAGRSFRAFLNDGYQGHHAVIGDFELHLSTAFPEIRLKNYIEVRGGDGGPRDAILALPALWKGLLYHRPSRKSAADLLRNLSPAQHREVFMAAYRHGIHAQTPNGTMLELAKELLALSQQGLASLATQFHHENEAVFLEPIREILDTKTSYADRLLAQYNNNPEQLCAITEKWAL